MTTETHPLLTRIAAIEAAIDAQVTGAPVRVAAQGDMVEYARLSLSDLQKLLQDRRWEAYRAGLIPKPVGGAIRVSPR